MLGKFPYEIRYKYPHLKPQDVTIWERFITAKPGFYESVDYDVALGEGAKIPTDAPENIARDFKILTQYKIDVVGYQGNSIDIMEIKPNAGGPALGQVKGYEALYKAYINPNAKTRTVVLTDQARPDIFLLAHELNVTIIII